MSQALKSFDVHIITGFNVPNKCEYKVFMGVLIFSSVVIFYIAGVFFVGVPHEIRTR